jgi:hypothetical protein
MKILSNFYVISEKYNVERICISFPKYNNSIRLFMCKLNNNSIQFNSIQFNSCLFTCKLNSTEANNNNNNNLTDLKFRTVIKNVCHV